MANILVIEDDRMLGELLVVLFEGIGHAATLAASGRAALEILEQNRHDVLFCDVHIQPVSGLELIKQIRKSHPGITVVFMSGDQDPDIENIGLDLGAFAFLHKPIQRRELKQVMERVIKGRAAGLAPLDPTRSEPELEVLLPGRGLAAAREKLRFACPGRAPILIEAPDGMVRAKLLDELHRAGPLPTGPLLRRNLATDPVSELEDLIASAKGGVIVFERTDAMPLDLQNALAAMMDRLDAPRVIMTVPGRSEALVAAGKLAEALKHKVVRSTVRLPALHEIEEDAPEILRAAIMAHEWYPFGRASLELEPDAVMAMKKYSWPDNLREIEKIAHLLISRLNKPLLTWEDLPEHVRNARIPSLEIHLRQERARHLMRALRVTRTQAEAAEILGVPLEEMKAFKPSAVIKTILGAGAGPATPPAVCSLLLVSSDDTTRNMLVGALGGTFDVVAVSDGLAAVAASTMAARPFAAALLVAPLPCIAAGQVGRQLRRISPDIRLGLMGTASDPAGADGFHLVSPSIKTGESALGFVSGLLEHPTTLAAA